tara:strand:- start:1221 stop:2429 length:1209 start_codon:yes stop_codon:yes gene_type:complete
MWGKRLLLMAVVLAVILKPADWLLGVLADTQRRHLLRLEPDVAVPHQSAEFDYVFHTNSLGFRGRELTEAKPDGHRRLVVLGDSFVAGVGVSDDAVFTERLADDLAEKRIDVVNLGRAGTSTVREVTLFRDVGRRFGPDVVLLMYYLGNDLAEILEEETDAELARWRPTGTLRQFAHLWCPNIYLELAMQKRRSRSSETHQPRPEADVVAWIRSEAQSGGVDAGLAEKRYRGLPDNIRSLAESGQLPGYRYLQACLDPDRFRNSLDPDDQFVKTAWQRTRTHLELLRSLVESSGGTLMLAVIPDASQVSEDALAFNRKLGFVVDDGWLERPGRTFQLVSQWAEETGVGLLDLRPVLRDTDEPSFFVQDGHCTPAGHLAIARAIETWPRLRKRLDDSSAGGAQ